MKRYLLSFVPLLFTAACAQPSGGGGSSGRTSASAPPSLREPVQRPIVEERTPVRLVAAADDNAGSRPARADRTVADVPIGSDQEFVRQAGAMNQADIELSRVAIQNSNNSEVRRLAQNVLQRHMQSQSDLRTVCRQLGLKMTEEVDARHQNMSSRLTRLRGINFDREYVQAMVEDHAEAITKFALYADEGYYREVRSFAEAQLPMLRDHWELARNILRTLRTSG